MNQLRFAAGTTAGSGLTYLTCAGKQEQFRWEMFLNGCFIHRLISLDTSKSNFGGCYLWTLTSGEWSQTCFWIENTYCSCFYFSVQCTLMKNIVSIVKMFSIEETYELILVFLNRHKSNKILRYNILDFLDPDPWVIHLKFWQLPSFILLLEFSFPFVRLFPFFKCIVDSHNDGVGHTAWAPKGREGRSSSKP